MPGRSGSTPRRTTGVQDTGSPAPALAPPGPRCNSRLLAARNSRKDGIAVRRDAAPGRRAPGGSGCPGHMPACRRCRPTGLPKPARPATGCLGPDCPGHCPPTDSSCRAVVCATLQRCHRRARHRHQRLAGNGRTRHRAHDRGQRFTGYDRTGRGAGGRRQGFTRLGAGRHSARSDRQFITCCGVDRQCVRSRRQGFTGNGRTGRRARRGRQPFTRLRAGRRRPRRRHPLIIRLGAGLAFAPVAAGVAQPDGLAAQYQVGRRIRLGFVQTAAYHPYRAGRHRPARTRPGL